MNEEQNSVTNAIDSMVSNPMGPVGNAENQVGIMNGGVNTGINTIPNVSPVNIEPTQNINVGASAEVGPVTGVTPEVQVSSSESNFGGVNNMAQPINVGFNTPPVSVDSTPSVNVGSIDTNPPLTSPVNNNPVNLTSTPSMDSTPNVNITSNVETENTTVEKKKSKLPLIIAPIVVVLLAVAGFVVFKVTAPKPYESAITSVFSSFKSKSTVIDLNKPQKVTMSISASSSIEDYAFLNNYSIDFTSTVDSKNNEVLADVTLNEKGKALLGLMSYYKDKNIYIKSDKLFDKVLYEKIDEIEFDEVETDTVSFLVNKFEEGLKKAFKEEKTESSKKDITVNGEKLNVNVTTYTINKDNIGNIVNNFVSVFEDDESIKKLSKLLGYEEKEIKEELEDIKKEDYSSFTETYKVSFYTKGMKNNFVGFAFLEGDKEFANFVCGDKYSLATINFDEETVMTIETKDKVSEIKYNSKGSDVVYAKLTEVSDKELNVDFSIMGSISVKLNVKVDNVSKVEAFDISNAVNIEELTEKDETTIENNLMKALEGSDLGLMINQLLSSYESAEQSEAGMGLPIEYGDGQTIN